jgi:organic radical activating enzyme
MSDDGSIPGKDLNLDSLAAFITRSFKGRKLTVLLNGGEPTLNPGLERFCSTILQEDLFSIILYSNMTACKSLYMNLKDLGVIIKPTFHGTVKDVAAFRKKLDDYQITEPVLVPCTKDNIQIIDQLKSILGEI